METSPAPSKSPRHSLADRLQRSRRHRHWAKNQIDSSSVGGGSLGGGSVNSTGNSSTASEPTARQRIKIKAANAVSSASFENPVLTTNSSMPSPEKKESLANRRQRALQLGRRRGQVQTTSRNFQGTQSESTPSPVPPKSPASSKPANPPKPSTPTGTIAGTSNRPQKPTVSKDSFPSIMAAKSSTESSSFVHVSSTNDPSEANVHDTEPEVPNLSEAPQRAARTKTFTSAPVVPTPDHHRNHPPRHTKETSEPILSDSNVPSRPHHRSFNPAPRGNMTENHGIAPGYVAARGSHHSNDVAGDGLKSSIGLGESIKEAEGHDDIAPVQDRSKALVNEQSKRPEAPPRKGPVNVRSSYGAVIETPKVASVASLRASFNSRGSAKPIMPMHSNDPRIRHSISAATSKSKPFDEHRMTFVKPAQKEKSETEAKSSWKSPDIKSPTGGQSPSRKGWMPPNQKPSLPQQEEIAELPGSIANSPSPSPSMRKTSWQPPAKPVEVDDSPQKPSTLFQDGPSKSQRFQVWEKWSTTNSAADKKRLLQNEQTLVPNAMASANISGLEGSPAAGSPEPTFLPKGDDSFKLSKPQRKPRNQNQVAMPPKEKPWTKDSALRNSQPWRNKAHAVVDVTVISENNSTAGENEVEAKEDASSPSHRYPKYMNSSHSSITSSQQVARGTSSKTQHQEESEIRPKAKSAEQQTEPQTASRSKARYDARSLPPVVLPHRDGKNTLPPIILPQTKGTKSLPPVVLPQAKALHLDNPQPSSTSILPENDDTFSPREDLGAFPEANTLDDNGISRISDVVASQQSPATENRSQEDHLPKENISFDDGEVLKTANSGEVNVMDLKTDNYDSQNFESLRRTTEHQEQEQNNNPESPERVEAFSEEKKHDENSRRLLEDSDFYENEGNNPVDADATHLVQMAADSTLVADYEEAMKQASKHLSYDDDDSYLGGGGHGNASAIPQELPPEFQEALKHSSMEKTDDVDPDINSKRFEDKQSRALVMAESEDESLYIEENESYRRKHLVGSTGNDTKEKVQSENNHSLAVDVLQLQGNMENLQIEETVYQEQSSTPTSRQTNEQLPRLIPSPRDNDAYRLGYFGNESPASARGKERRKHSTQVGSNTAPSNDRQLPLQDDWKSPVDGSGGADKLQEIVQRDHYIEEAQFFGDDFGDDFDGQYSNNRFAGPVSPSSPDIEESSSRDTSRDQTSTLQGSYPDELLETARSDEFDVVYPDPEMMEVRSDIEPNVLFENPRSHRTTRVHGVNYSDQATGFGQLEVAGSSSKSRDKNLASSNILTFWSTGATSQEEQEEAELFDDTDQWLDRDPDLDGFRDDFSLTSDPHEKSMVSNTQQMHDHRERELGKRSSRVPASKEVAGFDSRNVSIGSAWTGQDSFASPNVTMAVKTRKKTKKAKADVFDPFGDNEESGITNSDDLFSPLPDPFMTEESFSPPDWSAPRSHFQSRSPEWHGVEI